MPNAAWWSCFDIGMGLGLHEAAEMLSVSPEFVARLVADGVLPVTPEGLVFADDVVAYKARFDREREAALDELVREAQELGFGY